MNTKYILILLILGIYSFGFSQTVLHEISENDMTPEVDGILLEEEWGKADQFEIGNSYGRNVTVYVTYDGDHLYIAFKNLVNDQGIKINPEIMINANIDSDTWTQDTYWYHISYGCCSAKGIYYFWENCSRNPSDWHANTFPFKDGHNNIEVRIKWSSLNIDPRTGTSFRMAFKLSDPKERHTYWPEHALINLPNSWAFFKF